MQIQIDTTEQTISFIGDYPIEALSHEITKRLNPQEAQVYKVRVIREEDYIRLLKGAETITFK